MDKVTWTDSAIQDLNDIGDYIAKDSERYAQIAVNELFDSVDVLAYYPFLGKIVPEFEHENIRELVKGNYRIVYKIFENKRIDILTVHNSARLIENTYNFQDLDAD